MGNLIVKYSGSSPTDTLVSGKLYLWPPSQNTIFLNSQTNFVFLHSRKRLATVTDNFFVSRWPLRLRKLPLYYMQ